MLNVSDINSDYCTVAMYVRYINRWNGGAGLSESRQLGDPINLLLFLQDGKQADK
jgi:hypothetical protein